MLDPRGNIWFGRASHVVVNEGRVGIDTLSLALPFIVT